MLKKFIHFIVLVTIIAGCGSCTDDKKKIAQWASNIDGSIVASGTSFSAQLKFLEEEVDIDSVVFLFNGTRMASYSNLNEGVKITTEGLKLGGHKIIANVYKKNKKEEHTANITIISNINPTLLQKSIGATYPHDNQNFTEGFFFHNGMIYESTGMNGTSFICRYKLGSKPEIITTLPNTYFGEGSILYDNKLIQLTWKNGVGVVYDATTFQKTSEFRIGGEGWGLTYNDTNLIMSDGSHRVFFMDKETYATTKIIEVYDNKGKVVNLNELEYVNGVIYANIWESDNIVKIEANTGKVLAYIDCSGLLTKEEIATNKCDVLNGIAYDRITKKLYITGKYWPKIFELKEY